MPNADDASQAASGSLPLLGGPAGPDPRLPDSSRLELDQLLTALRDRAGDVLTTQGRLRSLLRANAAVASDLSLASILRRVVDATREVIRAEHAAVCVLGADDRPEEFVHTGLDPELAELLRRCPTEPDGAILAVPVQHSDAPFGMLYACHPVAEPSFTDEDHELATALAATASVSIAHARLFAESERRRHWLATSGELTRTLLTRRKDERFQVIVEQAAEAAGADYATLLLAADGGGLEVAAEAGRLGARLGRRVFPLDGTLAGLAFTSGKPLLARRHAHDPVESARGVDAGPVIVVPLAAGEKIRGVVILGRSLQRHSFSDADKSMAAAFGSHAAIALELVEARSTQVQLAQMEDHDRIARDLHDHVIQEVFAVGIGLQAVSASVDKPFVAHRIGAYLDTLDRVIARIRQTIYHLQSEAEYRSQPGSTTAAAPAPSAEPETGRQAGSDLGSIPT